MSAAYEPRFGHVWRRVERYAEALLDTLLPPACGYCGSPGQMFCPACRASVAWVQEPVCELCGRPVHDRVCTACKANPPATDLIRSATFYQDPVKRLIHRFKYEGLFALGRPLGALMVEAWPRWRQPVDLVLPVPLHSRRRSERGYNQSEYLVRQMRRHLGWPTD
ncbi:MAG: double zinc ribbon domain-containing protein, partial [Chloroflexota bacterium]